MHNNVKFVLVTRIFKCGGAAGIPIYPGGGRLCLSACPGDGEVKKIAAHPLRIISGTALTVELCLPAIYHIHMRFVLIINAVQINRFVRFTSLEVTQSINDRVILFSCINTSYVYR